jgi:hypothetical protein
MFYYLWYSHPRNIFCNHCLVCYWISFFTFNAKYTRRNWHTDMITQQNRTISKPLAPSKTKSAGKSGYERSVCVKEETF